MTKKKQKREQHLTTEFIRWVSCLCCDHKYFIEEEVPRKNRCPVCKSYEYDLEEENTYHDYF